VKTGRAKQIVERLLVLFPQRAPKLAERLLFVENDLRK
jgi:hypothetical protein